MRGILCQEGREEDLESLYEAILCETVVKAPDQRGEAAPEQVSLLAQVYKVEDDSLVSVNIVHCEVKPKPAKYFAKKN